MYSTLYTLYSSGSCTVHCTHCTVVIYRVHSTYCTVKTVTSVLYITTYIFYSEINCLRTDWFLPTYGYSLSLYILLVRVKFVISALHNVLYILNDIMEIGFCIFHFYMWLWSLDQKMWQVKCTLRFCVRFVQTILSISTLYTVQCCTKLTEHLQRFKNVLLSSNLKATIMLISIYFD